MYWCGSVVLMYIKEIILTSEVTEKFNRCHTKSEGCWIWSGSFVGRKRDRPRIDMSVSGVRHAYGAHRYAYTLLVGTIPEGLELDHLCKNPRCVNPEHLEPVTGRENKLREKGRKPYCVRGHRNIPENRISSVSVSLCKLCMRAYGRARRLGITVDEAVEREVELDARYERAPAKPYVSTLSYKVDWANDPHCRDCGHLLYASTKTKISGARIHGGKGRCWKCKRKFDKSFQSR